LQGQLLIAQGDAMLYLGDRKEADGNHEGAQKDWKDAASKFVVPSQVLDDAEVTPEALDKAARALDRLADKVNADEMRKQLTKRFPNFKPQELPAFVPSPKPEPTAPAGGPAPADASTNKDKAPPKAEKVE
jgi:hypothetical protein